VEHARTDPERPRLGILFHWQSSSALIFIKPTKPAPAGFLSNTFHQLYPPASVNPMSSRERNLLIFFGIGAFVILNLLGFNYYSAQRDLVRREAEDARLLLEKVEHIRNQSANEEREMAWLEQHEPEPRAYQEVRADLQQLVEREVLASGLKITANQKFLPLEAPEGAHFHSVKVQFNISGTDQALYSWVYRMNVSTELRAVTSLRLSANKENDSLLDCTAIVEQMFVPLPESL
jgi:hypothetical protein